MNNKSKSGVIALIAAAVAVLMILPAVSAPSEAAAGDVLFKRNFGGSMSEDFYSVIAVTDGYVAVGYTEKVDGDWAGRGLTNKGIYDAMIVKFNLDGSVAWAKNFGGPGRDSFGTVVAVPGGYVAIGTSEFDSFNGPGDWMDRSVSGKGNNDGIAVKFNNDGSIAWAKNFGGSGFDHFKSVISVAGGIIVVGYTDRLDGDWAGRGLTHQGSSDAVIMKINNDGSIAWANGIGGTSYDEFFSVAAISGGYVVVGYSGIFDGDWAAKGVSGKGGSDAIVVKFNTDGSYAWAKNFGGSESDVLRSVIPVSGGFVAVGNSYKFDMDWAGRGYSGKGNADSTIVMFNIDGSVAWAKAIGGSDTDDFWSVTAVTGGYIAVGYSNKIDADWTAAGNSGKGDCDATAVKFKTNGDMEWAKNFGGGAYDYCYGVAAIPGGVIAVGTSEFPSFGNGNWTGTSGKGGDDAILVKIDDGTFVPVTDITGVPVSATTGTDLTLTGTVVPSAATYKTITWAVKDAGTTNATISGNKLSTTSAGTVIVTATIANGTATGSFVKDFTITVSGGGTFVPVTNITGVPTSAVVGQELTLTGTVVPSGATIQTITWSVKNAGTTGATITGGKLMTDAAGTVEVTATISNGGPLGTHFTKDFTITVNAAGDAGSGGGSSMLLIIVIIAVIAVALVALFFMHSKGMLPKKGTK
ncbi:MAG: hypothetical protein FWC44_02635 [Methanomassiliicoccaceae archaeon]|nr:hypothetical protein [Methanomassiliicoccaceae archaeon]